MKKRLIAIVLTLVLLAACAAPALAAAPKAKKVECEQNGVVEVDFNSKKVQYRNTKVVVKDADGKKLSVKILEKDNDDITFKVTGLKAGASYAYRISGIRKGGSGSYGAVSGTFKAPSDKPKIKKVSYDTNDRELEVDFATRVQYKKLKVTVKDADGKSLAIKKIEKGSDDIEIKVKGMQTGKRYTVTVSGVRVKGKGSYISISKTFTA